MFSNQRWTQKRYGRNWIYSRTEKTCTHNFTKKPTTTRWSERVFPNSYRYIHIYLCCCCYATTHEIAQSHTHTHSNTPKPYELKSPCVLYVLYTYESVYSNRSSPGAYDRDTTRHRHGTHTHKLPTQYTRTSDASICVSEPMGALNPKWSCKRNSTSLQQQEYHQAAALCVVMCVGYLVSYFW